MNGLQVFIGYDSREPAAFAVLVESLIKWSTMPLIIRPLVLHNLPLGVLTRPREATASTEFSLSRFLVPYLSDYTGWSVFMDCDMLCQVDLSKLLLEIISQKDKAVLVCPHDYIPKQTTKFLGHAQTAYPRKNWSSFMVFNNARCKALTPGYVNEASGSALHRFAWVADDQIGRLPLEWNWLVGEYPDNPNARFLHYTNGGPWFGVQDGCSHLWDDAAESIRCGVHKQ